MPLVRGVHIIGDRKSKQAIAEIADDIRQNQRLLVGPRGAWGKGAYAWYEQYLPPNLRDRPQVLFEIYDSSITELFAIDDGRKMNYFLIPGEWNLYVNIRVIELRNV